MTTQTKKLKLCSKCDSELSNDGKCLKCDRKNKSNIKFVVDFDKPDYIFNQVKRLVEDVKNDEKDEYAQGVKISMIRNARHVFASKHMTEDDLVAAIDEATGVVRNLHKLDISSNAMKYICENVIRMGKIAESWKQFMAHGGRVNEQTFKATRPGVGDESSSATGRA